MDASQYKDYVLVLLFVKYVSDKYAGDPDGLIEIPEGGSFAEMVALKGDKEIGEKINIIIAKLAEANDLKGVIDVADFNEEEKLGTGKEMVDRLSNLVAIFNRPEFDFRKNRAEGDDILGDAYEYLMRHFATESGKSKGQFYTPSEVSRIMAKAFGISGSKRPDQTIYDPTCGSGSLLLRARDEAPAGITIYGQEKDVATRALAKMNMVLHDCPTAEIWRDNTLANPHFRNDNGTLKTFDFVVANPPFSDKAWATGLDPVNDLYDRFDYGVPPAKNGDYAYFLHIIASLKTTGKGAVILPHGVLFWRVLPAVRATLFGPGDRPDYLTPLLDAAEIKGAILNYAEFATFTTQVTAVFDAWSAAHIDRLRDIAIGDHPKELIAEISEDLLNRFKPVPLIDGYDVYQHPMTWWAEVMQDDTYILVQDGWAVGCVIRELVKNADGKFTETPDITLGRRKLKAELIPPALIVARFFAAEQAALEGWRPEPERPRGRWRSWTRNLAVRMGCSMTPRPTRAS